MEPIRLSGGRVFVPAPDDPFFRRPRVVLPKNQQEAPAHPFLSLKKLREEGRWLPLDAQPGGEELVLRRQTNPDFTKGAQWLRERFRHITGSTLSKFLGFVFSDDDDILECIFGARDAFLAQFDHEYDPDGPSGLTFKSDRDEAIGTERMRHGTEHEDDAMVTLLHYRPTMTIRECALQYLDREQGDKSLFADSQDGAGTLRANNGKETKVSFEAKCAYGNRDPQCYKRWKPYYVPQCLMHCEIELSDQCYAGCWTPTKTRIWCIMRNIDVWQRIVDFIYEIVSCSELGQNAHAVLAEAAKLRQACEMIADNSKEIRGSPFTSCYAMP